MFFELNSSLNLSTITNTFGANFSSIEYVLDMEASIMDAEIGAGQLTAKSSLTITFIEKPYSEQVAKWILVTSSGAAILLFLLILLCLISVSYLSAYYVILMLPL